jgi:hypothetical protein
MVRLVLAVRLHSVSEARRSTGRDREGRSPGINKIREAVMGFFNKKEKPAMTELKCPAEGCSFTCNDQSSMKRHIEWKHPEHKKAEVK